MRQGRKASDLKETGAAFSAILQITEGDLAYVDASTHNCVERFSRWTAAAQQKWFPQKRCHFPSRPRRRPLPGLGRDFTVTYYRLENNAATVFRYRIQRALRFLMISQWALIKAQCKITFTAKSSTWNSVAAYYK
jgi:hypothetical protein